MCRPPIFADRDGQAHPSTIAVHARCEPINAAIRCKCIGCALLLQMLFTLNSVLHVGVPVTKDADLSQALILLFALRF